MNLPFTVSYTRPTDPAENCDKVVVNRFNGAAECPPRGICDARKGLRKIGHERTPLHR